MRANVRCEIDKWLSDEPIPGLVEAHVTDAHGRTWRWQDKPTTFTEGNVSADSKFPVAGEVRCEILKRSGSGGSEILSARLIDIDDEDGNLLDVYGHQLVVPD